MSYGPEKRHHRSGAASAVLLAALVAGPAATSEAGCWVCGWKPLEHRVVCDRAKDGDSGHTQCTVTDPLGPCDMGGQRCTGGGEGDDCDRGYPCGPFHDYAADPAPAASGPRAGAPAAPRYLGPRASRRGVLPGHDGI